MKKGFTLIELVAILVLLGVIALITTPIIINITSRAEENTRVVSIIKYAEATKLAYTEELDNLTGKDLKELANLKMVDDKIVKCDGVVYTDSLGSVLYDCTVNDMGNYCYLNGNVYNNTDNCNSIKEIAITGKIPYLSPEIVEVNKYPIGYEYSQNKDYKVSFPSIVVAEEFKYIRVSENINVENVVSYCNSGNIPENCIPTNDTLLEPNIWYEVSGDVTFNSNKNIVIDALIGKAGNYDAKTRYVEEKIDTTSAISDFKYTTLTDKIVLTESCNDPESGITKYEYKINDGEYKVSKDGSYVFNKLTSNTKYNVSIRCTNGSGLSSEKTKTITTNIVKPPVITITSKVPSSGYSYYQNVTLTITYDDTNMDTAKYYYSLDGKNWVETSKVSNVTLKENKTLYAKTTDNINTSKYATYTITNIDMTKPNIKINVTNIKTDRVTLALTCSDTESGITKYEYSKDNGSTWVTGTGSSYTFTGLKQGTSYKYVGRCTNGSGLSNTSSSTNTTNTIPTPVITQVSQEPSSGTWAISRTLRITYNNTNVENAKYYYSYDRTNWTLVTSLSIDLKFTENGYLYAKTTDGTNTVSTTAYTVTNIESSDPSIPSITYNGGSNTCSWKNNYNLTLSSSASSGIAYYEIDVDNNGTSDGTTGSNFIPSNGWSACSARFRAVTNAGRRSGWTDTQHIHMDTSRPEKPTIVLRNSSTSGNLYTSGTWTSNNIYHIATSKDNVGVSYYQYSHDGINWVNDINNWSGSYNSDRSQYTYVISWSGQWNFYVRSVDYAGNVSESSNMYTLRIDKSRPTIDVTVSDVKSDRATINASCADPETGITKYEYSNNNGASWVTGNASYTFTGLNQNASYKYKARCTNGVGLTSEVSISSQTTEVKAPTIVQVSQTPSGTWAVSRTIRITYYNTNIVGARYYYSYNGSNWIEVSGTTDLTFTSNSLLYAKTTDASGNYKTASTYTVTNIESSDPSIPSITYNGGSNTCSWKNNYNLTLSSSASSGIAYYEIDVDNNGTSDGTTGSNFIPSNGWSTCSARFRAVTNAGRRSGWTDIQHIHMDTTGPSTPSITYNGGSNTCSWKNNYDLTLSSSDNIGVSYYQIDVDGNGTADSNINSNWIPENGFHSHNVRFRAVDHAGNVSAWTSNQHIHMDTEKPTFTTWWWGETGSIVNRLYIRVTDNASGINRVQCPTSTASGNYNNWHWYNAVWDSSANAYRCDITPSTFDHYGQNYTVHLYMYDNVGNGGYYNNTSISIPSVVCSVNNSKYSTLQSCVDSSDGSIIRLLSNVNLTSSLVIPSGKNVTMYLQNHTISSSVTNAVILNYGTLTIGGQNVNDSGNIISSTAGQAIASSGTLYIWSGNYSSTHSAVLNNGGTLAVASGTFKAKTGLGMNCGETTILGGTFQATEWDGISLWSDCEGSSKLYYEKATTIGINYGLYLSKNVNVTINGGSITSKNTGIYSAASSGEINIYKGETPETTISGNTFALYAVDGTNVYYHGGTLNCASGSGLNCIHARNY